MSELKKWQPEIVQPREEVYKNIQIILSSILRNILIQPESAYVTVRSGERTTIFEIEVLQADFGRLIGSRGKTITALRTMVAVMCATHGFRAIIEIKNEDNFFK